jgi:hypothetical protein
MTDETGTSDEEAAVLFADATTFDLRANKRLSDWRKSMGIEEPEPVTNVGEITSPHCPHCGERLEDVND